MQNINPIFEVVFFNLEEDINETKEVRASSSLEAFKKTFPNLYKLQWTVDFNDDEIIIFKDTENFLTISRLGV